MGKLIIEGNNIYEIDDECDQERNHRSQREQNLPKETPEVNEQNRKTNQRTNKIGRNEKQYC